MLKALFLCSAIWFTHLKLSQFQFRQPIAKLPRNPLEEANSIIIQACPNQNFLISGRNSAKIGPNSSHNNKNHCVIYFILSSFDKLSLNLREPEDALVWLDAFSIDFVKQLNLQTNHGETGRMFVCCVVDTLSLLLLVIL